MLLGTWALCQPLTGSALDPTGGHLCPIHLVLTACVPASASLAPESLSLSCLGLVSAASSLQGCSLYVSQRPHHVPPWLHLFLSSSP